MRTRKLQRNLTELFLKGKGSATKALSILPSFPWERKSCHGAVPSSALCTENYWSEKATGDESKSHMLKPPAGEQLLQPSRCILSKGQGWESHSTACAQHPVLQEQGGWWASGSPGRQEEDGPRIMGYKSVSLIFSSHTQKTSECRKILGMNCQLRDFLPSQG